MVSVSVISVFVSQAIFPLAWLYKRRQVFPAISFLSRAFSRAAARAACCCSCFSVSVMVSVSVLVSADASSLDMLLTKTANGTAPSLRRQFLELLCSFRDTAFFGGL